jgi:acetyl esterase/lipase
VPVLENQSFTTPSGEVLTYDFYSPDHTAPLVVLIHGGGWISGDRSMHQDEASWLADQGYAAACISYRLAPLYPFPAAIGDAQSFVRHARANAQTLNFDPNRVAALGNSAGGHLALMLGLCPTPFDGGEDDKSFRANAVVDICGITDLRNPHVNHHPISVTFLEEFMGGHFEEGDEKWSAASPIVYAKNADTPVLIMHGTLDDVVRIEQSDALARSLLAAGGDVTFVEMEGEGHSFTWEAWSEMRGHYMSFLKRVFA